jgi:hypothetical protein
VTVTTNGQTGKLVHGYTYGTVAPIVSPPPPGATSGSPGALPTTRPSPSTNQGRPNVLPATRP